jgi:hypothetical protein
MGPCHGWCTKVVQEAEDPWGIAKANVELDKQLQEEKVRMKEQKWDLDVREVAFREVVMKNAHLMEHQTIQDDLDQLKECLAKVQADRLSQARELVSLMTKMSGALVDLGLDHVWFILESPQHDQDVLQLVDDVLRHLWEMKGVIIEVWT